MASDGQVLNAAREAFAEHGRSPASQLHAGGGEIARAVGALLHAPDQRHGQREIGRDRELRTQFGAHQHQARFAHHVIEVGLVAGLQRIARGSSSFRLSQQRNHPGAMRAAEARGHSLDAPQILDARG
jgi:hypothetical protein